MVEQGERYLRAWHALGQILQNGGSWSGHERNCCFLNTRSERFADVSAAVGFDHDADTRGVALVDWDGDGDLDVWTSNRTAPRVRYLENHSSSENGFLVFRLRGTDSNRDAIGARLELTTERNGKQHTRIQSLRAGEGYLSQSSKDVHFGLGDERPVRLLVCWPNGGKQSFEGLQANTHYHVVEGGSELQSDEPRNVKLADAPPMQPSVTPNLRILPSRRLPMPQLQMLDGDGKSDVVNFNASDFTLLTLWASWCQPCIEELQDLQKHQDELQDLRVRWLPVNVDGLDSEDLGKRWRDSSTVLDRIQVTAAATLATKSAVECLDVVQKSLTTKQGPLPVPCSFLVDGNGRLVVVYKGAVDSREVIRDVHRLREPTADPRDHAIPFPGTWILNTFPPDLMAIATSLMNVGLADEALHYMQTNIPTKNFAPPITKDLLAETYLKLSRILVSKRRLDTAEHAILQALKVDASNSRARLALGDLHLVRGDKANAVKQYRELLKSSPRQPMALNNLAWILATSKDKRLLDAKQAVVLAERLCSLTKYGEPISLDTYAVALASDGQFDKAIEWLQKAIELTKRTGRPTATMETRLKLFKAQKAYVE